MAQGFIKLNRSILNWEWYDDINVTRVFIHCLLKANFKKTKWHGKTINRGCFITTYRKLAEETSLSLKTVRVCLEKLQKTEEIEIESDKYNTLIVVKNYDKFQILGHT